ncbi:phytoene desaturase family protein [Aliihoeflea sp. PC F10.4]
MHDVVIIGAGHNGLVCGAYLAKAGLSVLALERREIIGGACVTEETWPGFKVSTASYLMSLLQPKIILDLDLLANGLEVLRPDPTFVPFDDGHSMIMWPNVDALCGEFARFSEKDAKAYPRFLDHLERMTQVVRDIIWETPIDITDISPAGLRKTSGLLMRQLKHRKVFYDVFDVLTMSGYDYLTKWFESDEVIAAIGYYVTGGGTNRTMKMPATAFSLLRPLLRDNTTKAGPSGFVRGGMGSISNAIARSGAHFGLKTRTGCTVEEIIVDKGRATGVRLTTGEVIEARRVISNANAKTTFLRLAPESALSTEFRRDVANIRTQSSLFKVHLAVKALPHYTAFSSEHAGFAHPGMVRMGTSTAYLEKAHQDYREGRMSSAPFLTIMAPSLYDDTLAPSGKHVMSIMGGHAPYDVEDRDAARKIVLDTVLTTIDRHAPGFSSNVEHAEVLMPIDLEERFDLPNGHVHHGDMTIDQTFFRRPVPAYADYRTPIANLYLCGSAVHPGGGVTGVPGHNAAREVLRDAGSRSPVFKQLKNGGRL